MRLGALAFLAGGLVFHGLAEVPDRLWLWIWLAVPLLYFVRGGRLRPAAWLLAGWLWPLLWLGAPTPLPPDLAGQDVRITGWIASLPEQSFRSTRFQFIPATLELHDRPLPWRGKLLLTWYERPPLPLQVGDHWELTVRLKRPRGLANPGGFDRERRLFSAGIVALGYVRPQPAAQRLAVAERYPIDRFRQAVAERFRELLPHDPQVGVLAALAVGDEQGIAFDQWEVFARTGTSHLISVSGLHIGLIAGLVFLLMRGGWGCVPWLMARWPAVIVATVAGLLAATGYALLAGLSLPTVRALVMVAVVMVAVLSRRLVTPGRVLERALLAVLLFDPAAPLSYGFWLSFGSIAVILYAVSGRRQAPSAWPGELLRVQAYITLGLVPLSLLLFQRVSLLSLPANLIAIPWTSVTTVPLSLLAIPAGAFGADVQAGVLRLAALSMAWLWDVLVWLSALPWAQVHLPAPPGWTLLFALPGLALLLAPRGWPGRWLGLVLGLPLVFYPQSLPPPGGMQFTLLDVGKGLSVVVRTRNHLLVYDTGPRMGVDFDAGKAALVPFLRQQGVRRVDLLILSHADKGHTGGTRSLLEQFPVATVLTPSPLEVPVEGAQTCEAGREWVWDEVRFRILHPPATGEFAQDEASCVLLVEAGERLLLPGDIGPAAARRLVQDYGNELAAGVMVAPQQGGRGVPPAAALLAAVKPRYVLFADAPGQADGLAAVMEQYREAGAVVLGTAESGSITFRLEDGLELQPELYREQVRHYWQGR
jgi:competence protein ComEC